MKARSFLPIADPQAKILILGSMPGVESLRRRQYYAHPQNRFWPLMADILDFEPTADYAARTQALMRNHVALWDVLKTCERPGSLDSNIRKGLINDFASFFRAHPQIHTVFFNGVKAEASFHRQALSALGALPLRYVRLPSTSPANAAISLAKKKRAWSQIKTSLR